MSAELLALESTVKSFSVVCFRPPPFLRLRKCEVSTLRSAALFCKSFTLAPEMDLSSALANSRQLSECWIAWMKSVSLELTVTVYHTSLTFKVLLIGFEPTIVGVKDQWLRPLAHRSMMSGTNRPKSLAFPDYISIAHSDLACQLAAQISCQRLRWFTLSKLFGVPRLEQTFCLHPSFRSLSTLYVRSSNASASS